MLRIFARNTIVAHICVKVAFFLKFAPKRTSTKIKFCPILSVREEKENSILHFFQTANFTKKYSRRKVMKNTRISLKDCEKHAMFIKGSQKITWIFLKTKSCQKRQTRHEFHPKIGKLPANFIKILRKTTKFAERPRKTHKYRWKIAKKTWIWSKEC